MAFTGKLGTPGSQLESIVLGSDSAGPHSFNTTILVNQSFGRTGARTEVNVVEASSFISGDIVTGPPAGSIRSYSTVVGVRNSESHGAPLLKRFETVVAINTSSVKGGTRRYATTIGVGQGGRRYLDGRPDILHTGGYRR